MIQALNAVLLATTLAAAAANGPAAPPLLLQEPALSRDQIAFQFGGEIWTVPRKGGVARRLVAGQGRNGGPRFSPDGSWIAYQGTYDENTSSTWSPPPADSPGA